ncbi:MAG TPA: TRAP transporter small permease [Patescibacteria group bacterium]|nr:TRAP transporter small permease [Patescibacteria group bacterium]
MKAFVQWLSRGLERFETGLLTLFALTLVVLAAAQIIARWIGQSPEWLALPVVGWLLGWTQWIGPWVDPFLRVLVLWVGMFGALAAARDDRHISLDMFSRRWQGAKLRVARVLAFGFAALVSAMLARASLGLVELERESGTFLFGDVPMWWAQLILPLGFAALALRLAVRGFSRPAPVAT